MTDEVIASGHGGRQAATAEMARCLGHKEGALSARPMPFVPNTRSGVCVAVDVESLILEASENCALIAQKARS
jgi:hypothetical protein